MMSCPYKACSCYGYTDKDGTKTAYPSYGINSTLLIGSLPLAPLPIPPFHFRSIFLPYFSHISPMICPYAMWLTVTLRFAFWKRYQGSWVTARKMAHSAF